MMFRWAGWVAVIACAGCGGDDVQGRAEDTRALDAAEVAAEDVPPGDDADGTGEGPEVGLDHETADQDVRDSSDGDAIEAGADAGWVDDALDGADEVGAIDAAEIEVAPTDAAEIEVAPIDCGDCDDDLDCTNDVCGADGICQHHPKAGWCNVAGRCVEAGDGPEPCRICVPDVRSDGLTSLAGGPCDDGDPCTIDDQCVLGTCGGTVLACETPAVCHVSLGCDPDVGGCIEEPIADGTPCGEGRVCEVAECVVGDGMPTGTVAWFEALRCPEGWEQYAPATGRTLVPVGPAGPAGGVWEDGAPLASGAEMAHAHAVSGPVTVGAQRFVGVAGGGNPLASPGVYTATGGAAEASLGLPYLQLLACTKTSPDVMGAPPAGVFAFAAEVCGPDWEASAEGADRLVVGVPEGGSAGATFGAPPGLASRASHTHAVSGAFTIGGKGIALASGCCSPDFASSSDPNVSFTSGPPTDGEVLFPWRAAPQCMAPTGDGPETAPPGIVLFASDTRCPDGWVELESARGRIIVGAATGGDVGVTVGAPLADREDRAHRHTVALTLTLPDKNIAAANGGNQDGAAPGRHDAMFTSAPATSGLPFRQLLVCRK